MSDFLQFENNPWFLPFVAVLLLLLIWLLYRSLRETAAQEEFLRASGCDELQGYRLGRPVPAREFRQLLEKGEDR